jgi:CheY-like chemotaxis protein
VFLDYSMPRKDGLAAAAEITEFCQENNSPTPLLVLISGLSQHELQKRPGVRVMDLIISKPAQFTEVEMALQHATKSRNLRRGHLKLDEEEKLKRLSSRSPPAIEMGPNIP